MWYNTNELYSNTDSYVEWLESFTRDDYASDGGRLTYHKLIDTLWAIPFTANLGNDIDRAKEGLELRREYNAVLADRAGEGEFETPDVHEIFGKCRVLEMLIALSMQMYDIMLYSEYDYESSSPWFWGIMRQLGFDEFDDEHWVDGPGGTSDLIVRICTDIMEHRDILEDGTRVVYGGWFRVKGWSTMEIWYQMHAYLQRYF